MPSADVHFDGAVVTSPLEVGSSRKVDSHLHLRKQTQREAACPGMLMAELDWKPDPSGSGPLGSLKSPVNGLASFLESHLGHIPLRICPTSVHISVLPLTAV